MKAKKGGGREAKSKGRAKMRAGAAKGAAKGAQNEIPTGSQFLRFHTAREMIANEKAAKDAGKDKEAAFWKACQMRRARKSLRKIAEKVGIPYATLRRKMLEVIARRRRIRYNDDRYKRRGELYVIELDAEMLFGGVDEKNRGKNGHPYVFGDEIFKAIAIYRAATGAQLRQIEGMLKKEAKGEFRVPSFSQIRKRTERLSVSECEGYITIGKGGPKLTVHHILIDASGWRSTTRSAYRADRYGNAARGYHKVVVAVDAATNLSLSVEVLDEKVGDSPALLRKMIKSAFDYIQKHDGMELGEDVTVSADGSFDANDSHRDAAEGGYRLNCPTKRNSSPKAPPMPQAWEEGAGPCPAPAGERQAGCEKPAEHGKPAGCEKPAEHGKEFDGEVLRHRAVLHQQGGIENPTAEDYEKFKSLTPQEKWENMRYWAGKSGYTLRQKIEAWFGASKATTGDGIRAKKPSSVKFEVGCKVSIYNHMIDDAISRGYTAEVVEKGPDGTMIICNTAGKASSTLCRGQPQDKQGHEGTSCWNKKGVG